MGDWELTETNAEKRCDIAEGHGAWARTESRGSQRRDHESHRTDEGCRKLLQLQMLMDDAGDVVGGIRCDKHSRHRYDDQQNNGDFDSGEHLGKI
jgi:hypothetical protein